MLHAKLNIISLMFRLHSHYFFTGTTCHLAKQMACRSNPCQNGGTCVNTYDYYQCIICRDGFKGNHCQEDVNDCIPTLVVMGVHV